MNCGNGLLVFVHDRISFIELIFECILMIHATNQPTKPHHLSTITLPTTIQNWYVIASRKKRDSSNRWYGYWSVGSIQREREWWAVLLKEASFGSFGWICKDRRSTSRNKWLDADGHNSALYIIKWRKCHCQWWLDTVGNTMAVNMFVFTFWPIHMINRPHRQFRNDLLFLSLRCVFVKSAYDLVWHRNTVLNNIIYSIY